MAAKKTETAEAAAETAEVVLVKMERTEAQFEGGPKTAEVHPAEVGNYEAGGWRVAVDKSEK
jgi:hypothetical protein